MATPTLKLPSNNIYSNGYIIALADNKLILKRDKLVYQATSTTDIFHTVKESEQLWQLAYKYYKDSKLWFIIADANGVINPFSLDIGTQLVIPDLNKIKLK